MNTTRHLTPATLVAATLAALVLLQAPQVSAAEPVRVVQLPTVHVVAPRSALKQTVQVVQLPTVVITAKRPVTLLAAVTR